MSLNRTKKLPIGIENFEKLRREDFYYIDKTGLIGELLYSWGGSEFVYTAQTVWQVAEYEYAEVLF